MQSIKTKSFIWLIKNLMGKKVNFKSDCELFPNFDVTGKPISYYINGNELILKIKTSSGKTIDIGSNMKNLRYEILYEKTK